MSKGLAFHEDAAAFGPCEGPNGDPEGDVSWFCRGAGTERFDPLSETLRNAILCGPCNSMREAKVIDRAVQIMMEGAR